MPPITSLPSLQKLEDFANGDTGANPLVSSAKNHINVENTESSWKLLAVPVSSVRCVYPKQLRNLWAISSWFVVDFFIAFSYRSNRTKVKER